MEACCGRSAVLAFLAMGGGLLGMMGGFAFLTLNRMEDLVAGAAGFVAGAILVGCGLLSLTLLSLHKDDAPRGDGFTPSRDR